MLKLYCKCVSYHSLVWLVIIVIIILWDYINYHFSIDPLGMLSASWSHSPIITAALETLVIQVYTAKGRLV